MYAYMCMFNVPSRLQLAYTFAFAQYKVFGFIFVNTCRELYSTCMLEVFCDYVSLCPLQLLIRVRDTPEVQAYV